MRTAWLTLLASACLSVTVHAEPARGDAAAAQLFFERGRDAAARGDHAAACKNFEESLRLDLAVGTLFNLARCEEQQGRLASAWQYLHEGIDRLDEHDARRPQALETAGALEPRVPQLTIVLAAGSAAQVRRDDVALSSVSLGVPLPVNPGEHRILVQSPGRADARFVLTMREGERRTLAVAPGPLRATPPPPPPPAAPRPWRTAGWIVGGTGAVTTVAGLVLASLAFERSQVVHDRCDASGACDGAGLDALGSSQRFGNAATVTLVTGGVLLGAGAAFWWLGRHTPPARAAFMKPLISW